MKIPMAGETCGALDKIYHTNDFVWCIASYGIFSIRIVLKSRVQHHIYKKLVRAGYYYVG